MLTREEIRSIVREHLGKQVIRPLTQRDAAAFAIEVLGHVIGAREDNQTIVRDALTEVLRELCPPDSIGRTR